MSKARMIGYNKPYVPNSRAEAPWWKQGGEYWSVRRDGVPLAVGPKSTMPSAEERKAMRAGGMKVFVEGKIYREEKR